MSTAQANNVDLEALLDLIGQAESASNGLEIATALKALRELMEEIQDSQAKLDKGELRAQLGKTADTAATDIMAATKNMTPAVN